MLGDYVWLTKYRILPHEGGRVDQDPRWLEAVPVIEDEIEACKVIAKKVGARG